MVTGIERLLGVYACLCLRPGLEFRGEAWDAQSMNGTFKREKARHAYVGGYY